MVDNITHADLLAFTTDIVAAHLSNQQAETKELPEIIRQVYKTLISLENNGNDKKEEIQPAVPIKKSVGDDYIICLEDGKKMKMLKRHLKTAYNMTPDEYREKWSLPADYPMVAPDYAKKRSKLAKEIGLGTVGR